MVGLGTFLLLHECHLHPGVRLVAVRLAEIQYPLALVRRYEEVGGQATPIVRHANLFLWV